MNKNNKIQFFLIMILVIIINLFVFFPSFFHMERADHLVFLIETAKFDKFDELVRFTYSYCRNRQLEIGDQLLFRPGLYILLSLEKWFFQYNFTYWQILSFILHLIVLFQILRILYLFKPNLLAGLFVLNFSVWYLGQEMVIWHHLSGYLFFTVLFLQVFYHFVNYVYSGQQRGKELGWMLFYLTLGCFFYEFGVLCCIVFSSVLYFHRLFMLSRESKSKIRKKINSPWILSVPVVLYIGWSLADYLGRLGFKVLEMGGGTDRGSILPGISLIAKALWEGLLFPYFTTIVPNSNLRAELFLPHHILGYQLSSWQQVYLLYTANSNDICALVNFLYLFLGFLAVVYSLYLIVINKIKKRDLPVLITENLRGKHVAFILGVTLLFFILYLGIMIYGRFLPRGELYIRTSLYNFYFLALFLTIIGFLAFTLFSWHIRIKPLFLNFLIGMTLILSIFLNGYLTHGYNKMQRYLYDPLRNCIINLDSFVQAHRKEKDFSFTILWSQVDYKINSSVEDSKIKEYQKENMFYLFFPKFMSTNNAKYYIVYSIDSGLNAFKTEAAAKRYLTNYFGKKGD